MHDIKDGILLAVGDFPEGSATASRLRLIAKALSQGGLPITVALIHAESKSPVMENIHSEGCVEGIHYLYLNKRTVRPIGLYGVVVDTVRGIVGAIRLLLTVRKFSYMVLYTPILTRHGLPLLVALIRRIPVFIEICEIRSKATAGSKRRKLGKLLDTFDVIMEWLTPKVARGIIPISHGIEDFYRAKGVEKGASYLLPILVDIGQYAVRSAAQVNSLSGKDYFLNSGSFAEKDGIDYVLDAFTKVASDYPGLYLAFTGYVVDSKKELVEQRLEKSGLNSRVVFTGLLSREELVWAYQNAKALLSCRTNSEYANYGFPTKVGEYLASATPVIATRVGDIEAYLKDGDSAYLADAEDADSISMCMRQVMDDPSKALYVGNNGQEVANKNFNYSQYSDSLATFLNEKIGLARRR